MIISQRKEESVVLNSDISSAISDSFFQALLDCPQGCPYEIQNYILQRYREYLRSSVKAKAIPDSHHVRYYIGRLLEKFYENNDNPLTVKIQQICKEREISLDDMTAYLNGEVSEIDRNVRYRIESTDIILQITSVLFAINLHIYDGDSLLYSIQADEIGTDIHLQFKDGLYLPLQEIDRERGRGDTSRIELSSITEEYPVSGVAQNIDQIAGMSNSKKIASKPSFKAYSAIKNLSSCLGVASTSDRRSLTSNEKANIRCFIGENDTYQIYLKSDLNNIDSNTLENIYAYIDSTYIRPLLEKLEKIRKESNIFDILTVKEQQDIIRCISVLGNKKTAVVLSELSSRMRGSIFSIVRKVEEIKTTEEICLVQRIQDMNISAEFKLMLIEKVKKDPININTILKIAEGLTFEEPEHIDEYSDIKTFLAVERRSRDNLLDLADILIETITDISIRYDLTLEKDQLTAPSREETVVLNNGKEIAVDRDNGELELSIKRTNAVLDELQLLKNKMLAEMNEYGVYSINSYEFFGGVVDKFKTLLKKCNISDKEKMLLGTTIRWRVLGKCSATLKAHSRLLDSSRYLNIVQVHNFISLLYSLELLLPQSGNEHRITNSNYQNHVFSIDEEYQDKDFTRVNLYNHRKEYVGAMILYLEEYANEEGICNTEPVLLSIEKIKYKSNYRQTQLERECIREYRSKDSVRAFIEHLRCRLLWPLYEGVNKKLDEINKELDEINKELDKVINRELEASANRSTVSTFLHKFANSEAFTSRCYRRQYRDRARTLLKRLICKGKKSARSLSTIL